MNVRGGIELGFMSTTLKKQTALGFANKKGEDGSVKSVAPLVFEMQMGMVDRGAPVKWCSQIPAEEEVLFAPLTGLEVVGAPRIDADGRTLLVELRLNCNLHDMTIEQASSDKFESHACVHIIVTIYVQFTDYSQDVCLAPWHGAHH